MQKIEIIDTSNLDIHCPFCGFAAIKPGGISQCEHSLFLASDEGFEFVSPKLKFTADIDLDDKTIDEFTDELEYPGSIKFALYQPAPSFFGAYVAFAPD